MNKLILLPGGSSRNRTWLAEASAHFGDLFDTVYAQPYSHWETEEKEVNPEHEFEKLQTNMREDGLDTTYYLFARSIGAVLSLKAIRDGIVLPKRCVFFGVPLNLIADQPEFIGGWEALGSFPVSTLTFHNRHDPIADYKFLVSKLTETNNTTIEVITTEGDHHHYQAYNEYLPRIRACIPTP